MHAQRAPRPSRQQGVATVLAAVWLGVAMVCLMALDVGHVFWQKRELQKIADLAALAGVAQTLDASCTSAAQQGAGLAARHNGLATGDQLTVAPLYWRPPAQAAAPLPSPAPALNACRVVVQRNVPYFFVFNAQGNTGRAVSAEAIARLSAPMLATVAVRSTAAAVNDGMLTALLNGALGTNLSVNAIGWRGLANVQVDLLKVMDSMLAANVGLGGYDSLLQSQVSLAALVQAMVQAVEPGQAADVSAGLLGLNQLLAVGLGGLKLKLADLVQVDNSLPSSALQVGLNALELVQAALQLATKDNAVALNLGIPGTATVKLKVVEPAQFAIIADPRGSAIIEARTAQIRLLVSIQSSLLGSVTSLVNGLTSAVTSLVSGLLGGLLGADTPEIKVLAGNPLTLDLLVDVARGYARVEDGQCSAGQKRLDLRVKKALVDVYIGRLPGSTTAAKEANAFGAALPTVDPVPILDVGLKKCAGLLCSSPTHIAYYFGGIGLGGHLAVVADEKTVSYYNRSGLTELNDFQALAQGQERLFHTVNFSSLGKLSELLQGANLLQSIEATGKSSNLLSVLVGAVNYVVSNLLPQVLALLNPVTAILDSLLASLGIVVNQIDVAPYLQCDGGGGGTLVH